MNFSVVKGEVDKVRWSKFNVLGYQKGCGAYICCLKKDSGEKVDSHVRSSIQFDHPFIIHEKIQYYADQFE